MSTLLDNDNFVSGLNGLFRGKARWEAKRCVVNRSYEFSFRCDRLTPEYHVAESVIEDVNEPMRFIARQCIGLYERHHRLIGAWEQDPILTCPSCRSPVDMPSNGQQQSYEYCIEQAEAWMNRAVKVRR